MVASPTDALPAIWKVRAYWVLRPLGLQMPDMMAAATISSDISEPRRLCTGAVPSRPLQLWHTPLHKLLYHPFFTACSRLLRNKLTPC